MLLVPRVVRALVEARVRQRVETVEVHVQLVEAAAAAPTAPTAR